ncbi:hypothetical protein MK489_02955 [Myxococcota bacterium]|nr:hypothetical protein [Myxococcota bacterium]
MRSRSRRFGLGALAAIGAVLFASTEVAAGSAAAAQPRSRDILARVVRLPDAPFAARQGSVIPVIPGLGFSQNIHLAGRDLRMSIQGPVYRSVMRKRKYGLRMEVSF